jgi:hypothetical protein
MKCWEAVAVTWWCAFYRWWRVASPSFAVFEYLPWNWTCCYLIKLIPALALVCLHKPSQSSFLFHTRKFKIFYPQNIGIIFMSFQLPCGMVLLHVDVVWDISARLLRAVSTSNVKICVSEYSYDIRASNIQEWTSWSENDGEPDRHSARHPNLCFLCIYNVPFLFS